MKKKRADTRTPADGTPPGPKEWRTPVLERLPKLTELTLQSGGPMGSSVTGGGGTGGGGGTVF